MAADDYSTEHHLTPDGWVDGTKRFFGVADGGEKPRPRNALETWEEHTYQSSIYSNDKVTHAILWYDPNTPVEERRALRAKFNSPFMQRPDRFLET